MRQDLSIWLINQSHRVGIKLKYARKTHERKLQLDIYKGIPMGKIQHKFQEEYEALAQSHGGTIQRTPPP